MTINAPTITVGRPNNRTPLDIGEEIEIAPSALRYEATLDAITPPRSSPMPLSRRFLRAFAIGLTVSALAAVLFGIAGSDDGTFVSLLAAGGFLSLTATAALRWFSNGRI